MMRVIERLARTLIFVLALGLWPSLASAQQQPLVLGMLEDTPGHYSGEPHYRSVRVVFYKEGSDWRSFPSGCPDQECLKTVVSKYPSEVKWTISFDGRGLGEVKSRVPAQFDFYATIGQESITSEVNVPTVGRASQSFAGFLGEPVYRPLIADSKPFFKDPEEWKRARLSSNQIALLRRQFRAKFPKVTNCANAKEDVAKVWLYRDEDMKVTIAYSSKRNWSIGRIRLEEYRCDGPGDDAFADQWFAISPESKVMSLGEAMWFVDAGDYDDDGQSELIFSIADDNRGGYKLFYNDFQKSAVFEFGYH